MGPELDTGGGAVAGSHDEGITTAGACAVKEVAEADEATDVAAAASGAVVIAAMAAPGRRILQP